MSTPTKKKSFFPFVVIVCDQGTFGEDCNDACGNCLDNDGCNHINGTCLTGCKPGFQGSLCQKGT